MPEQEKPFLKGMLEQMAAAGGIVGIFAVVLHAPILAINAFVVGGGAYFTKKLAYN